MAHKDTMYQVHQLIHPRIGIAPKNAEDLALPIKAGHSKTVSTQEGSSIPQAWAVLLSLIIVTMSVFLRSMLVFRIWCGYASAGSWTVSYTSGGFYLVYDRRWGMEEGPPIYLLSISVLNV